MRWLILAWSVLVACGNNNDDDDFVSGACQLADELQSCPECSSGDIECTFEDTVVVRASCGDCQSRSALYQMLCDDGDTASAMEIEAQTECVVAP